MFLTRKIMEEIFIVPKNDTFLFKWQSESGIIEEQFSILLKFSRSEYQ